MHHRCTYVPVTLAQVSRPSQLLLSYVTFRIYLTESFPSQNIHHTRDTFSVCVVRHNFPTTSLVADRGEGGFQGKQRDCQCIRPGSDERQVRFRPLTHHRDAHRLIKLGGHGTTDFVATSGQCGRPCHFLPHSPSRLPSFTPKVS